MSYPRFRAPIQQQEDGEIESERRSLLDVLTVFRSQTSLPVEATASRYQFSGAENMNSYGSTTTNERSNEDGLLRNDDDDASPAANDRTRTEGGTVTDFLDIEEGINQNRSLVGTVETVGSDSYQNENPTTTEQQHTTIINEANGSEEAEQTPRDGAIGNITRRLRCLFSTITFPIVPLGTVVSLALLWVLYAASSLDLRKSCSHPLHSYAFVSLLLVAYIPNHSQVRSQIFHYSRERDGPVRPTRVRMYDQFFHTVCLLYVYTGATLIETCSEDLVDPNNSAAYEIYEQEFLNDNNNAINTCEATCPNLYQALNVYVSTLELFTFALILPLLFLPCIYLWFLQRAAAEAEAFASLQDRIQEEDALLSFGGVTTGEILNNQESVKIISRQQLKPTSSDTKPKASERLDERKSDHSHLCRLPFDAENQNDLVYKTENNQEQEQEQEQLWVLPRNADPKECFGSECKTKECCICMSEFDVEIVYEDDNSSSMSVSPSSVIEKKASDSDETEPLMVKPKETTTESLKCIMADTSSTIIRTRCGHLFHKECLQGWVGGMWSVNTSTSFRGDNTQQEWTKRKARQIHCPLCREDLRPNVSSRSNNNS